MSSSYKPDKQTHVRYLIVLMLFAASALSYGDRVVLSITGIAMARDIHMGALRLGYLFSGFSWAYVAGQLPAGGLLDSFGSKRVYGVSIVCWSICGALVGFAGYLPAAFAFIVILGLRLVSGLAQSPVFPGNGRIVAAWFPAAERGTASAIFNSSQYFALVLFAPIIGWITHARGWKDCFWFLCVVGFVLSCIWFNVIYDVKDHPRINQREIDYIEQGGGLTSTGQSYGGIGKSGVLTWSAVKMLMSNRMLVGIYLGQYCITTLTWFFLTWFPVYLNQARHMSIMKVGFVTVLPAFCGSVGGVLGGVVSDKLLRAGYSLTFSRKLPIVTGMLLSITMIACNHSRAQWLVILWMSLAFFGKGFGALGWTVISDTSPKDMVGLNGGLFNLIGNLAGITTPIVIGYIVDRTGSFNGALIFVGVTALMAIVSYLPIVGEIRRVDFTFSARSGMMA
ncbi:MFS transporter [Alloacidobacterium sp.]|uniref:MFS transporter n=1 Tax=Alloacidobacterium sp. TaxID=2951999 RepID=UPI002D6458B1|nr:MFS transporter [Alloacidobacterium sp.]HYK35714.1 MFS transporter [Alloacidobacterium sp.]